MAQQDNRKPLQPQTTAVVASPTPGGKGVAQPGRSELRWIKDKGLYSFNRFHSKWYGTKLHTVVDEFSIGRVITDRLTAKNDLLITAGTNDVFFGRIKDKINIGAQDVSLDLWTGEGWRLWHDEFDMSNLEIDNLIVRNEMWVNSFILNQVRAQNGDLVTSSAGKILSVEVVSTNVFDIIFEVDNAVDAQPFAQYDLILGRTLSLDEATTLTNVRLTVTAITVDGNTAKITASRVPGTSTPSTGDVVARVGNTTIASRMGSVWIIAESNQGPPFVDVRSGIDSWAKHDDPIGNSCIKARLGRIDDLTGNTNEFGLWTSNIYLTGSTVGVSASYSGTAAERDAFNAANPGVLKEGDRWSVTDENNNLYIWESGSWVDRVDDMIRTDGSGLINKAPAPSGSGLYLGSTYMGFYDGDAWRSYFDNAGNMVLGDSGGNAFSYNQSSNIITLQSSISGKRITIDGTSNAIKIYDAAGQVGQVSAHASGTIFQLQGNDTVQLYAQGAYVNIDGSGTFDFDFFGNTRIGGELTVTGNNQYFTLGNFTTRITIDGSSGAGATLEMKERSAAPPNTAGYGKLWVHDDAPTTLWFTDDDGTDKRVLFDVGGNIYTNRIYPGGQSTYYFYHSGNFKLTDTLEILSGDLFVDNAVYIGGWDTSIYRDSANVLKTTDAFQISQVFAYSGNVCFGDSFSTYPHTTVTSGGSGPTVYPVLNFINPDIHVFGGYGFTFNKNIGITGFVDASGGFKDNGLAGVDGTFLDNSGNTVRVSGGIITHLSL